MSNSWKFVSSSEQRDKFNREFPYRAPHWTRAEAEKWIARATYLWRGTGTKFTLIERPDGFAVEQDIA